MKPYIWKDGMTEKEMRDGAYWERNMLALYFAKQVNKTWEAFVELQKAEGKTNPQLDKPVPCGWYKHEGEGFEGWSRVISLFEGRFTFHVPDDFDMGDIPRIEPNWDGHSTEEKWNAMMKACGIKVDMEGK